MQRAIGIAPSSGPTASGVGAGDGTGTGSREGVPRPRTRPSPAEWLLLVYLLLVCVLTIVGQGVGRPFVQWLASSPDDVAAARVWSLVTSALLVDGPFLPQILATAVLGVVAIRLAGGRLFWSAAILAHVVGTLIVYAVLWIVDAASRSGVGIVMGKPDFGVSLIWSAALGVLAGVAWWNTRPLPRWAWALLGVASPVAFVGVTLASDGLALYEHVVAFGLAVGVVYAAQHWTSVGARLRLP